ncbi:MAG: hypothetical protein NPIRA02_29470 [Nitrospirales bacterium]|nr:MAG: hypothetical protein NPIRA02_29470 [Nitrospirales bacterium]
MMSIAVWYDEDSGEIRQVWKKFGPTAIQPDALPIHTGSVLIVEQDLEVHQEVQQDLIEMSNQPAYYHVVEGRIERKESRE